MDISELSLEINIGSVIYLIRIRLIKELIRMIHIKTCCELNYVFFSALFTKL